MTKEELILYSPYPEWINQEIKWLPKDDNLTYKNHLGRSDTCKKLRENGWLTNSFTYNFDSRGFRIPSSYNKIDTFDKDILFIGESNVCGIGLPWEETFAIKVAKKLQMNPILCARGGVSINTCFRYASYWTKIIKPTIVFLLIPPSMRFDMIVRQQDKSKILFGTNGNLSRKTYINVKNDWFNNFFEKWAINQDNGIFNNKSNTLAIEKIAEQNNCKFVAISMADLHSETKNIFAAQGKQHDWARDLAHWGKQSNDIFCDIVLEKIA